MPRKSKVPMVEVGYSLTLPFPPTSNHRTRNASAVVKTGAKQGKRYVRQIKTAAAAAYKQQAQMVARMAAVVPVDGPVELWLDVYRPTNRGDWDNYNKACCDAMSGFLWDDDRLIWRAHVTLHKDKVNPRVELRMIGLTSRQVVEIRD